MIQNFEGDHWTNHRDINRSKSHHVHLDADARIRFVVGGEKTGSEIDHIEQGDLCIVYGLACCKIRGARWRGEGVQGIEFADRHGGGKIEGCLDLLQQE